MPAIATIKFFDAVYNRSKVLLAHPADKVRIQLNLFNKATHRLSKPFNCFFSLVIASDSSSSSFFLKCGGIYRAASQVNYHHPGSTIRACDREGGTYLEQQASS